VITLDRSLCAQWKMTSSAAPCSPTPVTCRTSPYGLRFRTNSQTDGGMF
jgi:hypothetical protein